MTTTIKSVNPDITVARSFRCSNCGTTYETDEYTVFKESRFLSIKSPSGWFRSEVQWRQWYLEIKATCPTCGRSSLGAIDLDESPFEYTLPDYCM